MAEVMAHEHQTRQTMTGKRVSTLTPESSEAPRESLTGIPVEDREAVIAGNASVLLKDNALCQSTKTSSPELASLAAKYLDMSDAEMRSWTDGSTKREFQEKFWEDVRRLAASVLAQAEGTPRK
jgi:hypothetical protein